MKNRFSIIIPVKPGRRVKALEALKELDYPKEKVEIFIAEGSSPSRQRNLAAQKCSGDILYFLDDDSIVSPDLLQIAGKHYVDPDVAAVGGPSLTPRADTLLQQAFGATLSSFIGGGGVRNRYRKEGISRETDQKELILCNLSFRRDIFLLYGGLDERLYPNEENELMERLRLKGLKLIYDPALAISRSQRATFKAFLRQLFTYGRGRAEQTIISRRIDPASLIPPLFLIYLLLMPFVHNPVYTLPLLCYAGAVALNAGWESLVKRDFAMFPLIAGLVPAMHLAYGTGMIMGGLFPRFVRRKTYPSEVTLQRVELWESVSK